MRAQSPDQVLALAVGCGLRAIEWGADVHVPPGDLAAAVALARRCADAGVACPSYGSYLAAGRATAEEVALALDTAAALGASTVRVWVPLPAGPDDVVALVAAGAERGLTVATEFHPGTRTETLGSTRALLEEVGDPRLRTYWQPRPGALDDAELPALLDVLAHLHVFTWSADRTRLPLADGAAWPDLLAQAAAAPAGPFGQRVAYLEFVRDDDPARLADDAATLLAWLAA